MQAPVPKRKLTINAQELKIVGSTRQKLSPVREATPIPPVAATEVHPDAPTSYRCTCTARSRPCEMHLLASLIGGPRH